MGGPRSIVNICISNCKPLCGLDVQYSQIISVYLNNQGGDIISLNHFFLFHFYFFNQRFKVYGN